MVSGNAVGRSFLQENLNADVVGTRVPTTIGQIVRAFIEALSEKNAENVEDHTYIYKDRFAHHPSEGDDVMEFPHEPAQPGIHQRSGGKQQIVKWWEARGNGRLHQK